MAEKKNQAKEITIPESWSKEILDEVCLVTMGQSPPSKYYNTDGRGFPFFQGKAEFGNLYPTVVKWCEEPKKIAEKGDVLISVRAPVGPTNLSPTRCCIGRGLSSIRPFSSDMPSKYILYFLRSIESDIEKLGTGTTFKAISGAELKKLSIPIAPANEQKRIVAEIEKQFSRLDEAVENLQRVKANLKRYKASVLKAAVEGKLTEQWRAEHPDVEHASKLLERILIERRKKWEEAELAKMKAKGKVPKDDKWKKKYKEPLSQANKIDKIPESWEATSLEQITDSVRVICYGILMPKEHISNGILYVKVKDMKGNKINLDGLNRTSPEIAQKYERASLKTGDILLSIRGTYGRVAKVPAELNGGNITQDTSRLDITPLVDSDFVAFHLQNPETQSYFKKISRGVAVKGVNIADVKGTPINLPPYSEQVMIVEVLNRSSSFVEEVENYLENNLRKAERLRQSILKKAFTGQLIPQDPSDEPAEKLLERIINEKKKRASENGTKRVKRKKKMASKKKSKIQRDIIMVLTENKKPMKPEELFQMAGYDAEEVDQFYADLKKADQEYTIYQEKMDDGNVVLKVS